MRKINLYIGEEDLEWLKAESLRTGAPISEIIRRQISVHSIKEGEGIPTPTDIHVHTSNDIIQEGITDPKPEKVIPVEDGLEEKMNQRASSLGPLCEHGRPKKLCSTCRLKK